MATVQLQFIPARGRKQAYHGLIVDGRDCNLSPRGDGNSAPASDSQPGRGLQFIPARGRKLCREKAREADCRLQFIPARGRKPWYRGRFLLVSAIAIYPREGTETSGALNITSQGLLQFIPARGRKPIYNITHCYCNVIAIYPREGTETDMIKTFFPFCWIAIYPREGTETVNSAMFRASMVLQFIPARGRKLIRRAYLRGHPIAIYPREGTETRQ